jgi:hypothetical protein
MKTHRIIILAVALSMLAACGPAAAPTPEPTSILQGYYDAVNDKDIDKAMSFIAEDAVFTGELGATFSGHAEIRATLQSAIDAGVTFEVSDVRVTDGRLVYQYQAHVPNALSPSGTGLAIVKDGKIIFDGTEATWTEECAKDATQRFCAEG